LVTMTETCSTSLRWLLARPHLTRVRLAGRARWSFRV